MVTGVQTRTPHCSTGISSGKQEKVHSTSQPHFRSGDTPATIEADQILLALQQLSMNSNSANFNNNVNKISKLRESLTTTMPTFNEKSKKFKLFERLIQTSSKIHNQLTEKDKTKQLPLSHAWRCATNIQKHHQPQKREFDRNHDSVP